MGEAKWLDDKKKVAKRNTTRRIRKKFITKNIKRNIILSYHIRFKRFVRGNIVANYRSGQTECQWWKRGIKVFFQHVAEKIVKLSRII